MNKFNSAVDLQEIEKDITEGILHPYYVINYSNDYMNFDVIPINTINRNKAVKTFLEDHKSSVNEETNIFVSDEKSEVQEFLDTIIVNLEPVYTNDLSKLLQYNVKDFESIKSNINKLEIKYKDKFIDLKNFLFEIQSVKM
jgi:hypothetical protein